MLSVIAFWLVRVLVRFYLAIFRHHHDEYGWSALHRHFSRVIGFEILAISAVRMTLGCDDNHNWFASGVIVLLFAATLVS